MASRSFSKTIGQTEFQIVEGANAPGVGDIELRVDLTKIEGGHANWQVVQFLEELQNYLMGKGTTIG